MKRLLSALLALGLVAGSLVACQKDESAETTESTKSTSEKVADSEVSDTDPSTESADSETADTSSEPQDSETEEVTDPSDESETTEETAPPTEGDAVKTGLGVAFSNTNSRNAEGDKAGVVDTQAYVAAVLVDSDGKLISVAIDALQSKFEFTAKGAITTTPDTAYESKQTLGDDYNMRQASDLGKEWYEQADSFAEYVIGKTKDEVAGIKGDEADLTSSVTMKIGAMQAAVVEAIERAEALGASKDDKLGIGVLGSAKQTKQEADDKGLATTVAYNYYAASTFDAEGRITSQILDASQAKFEINEDGTIKTPLDTEFDTKLQLGPDYGMKGASEIGKEWDEQAKALAKYVTGKTVDEVLGLPLEDGAPTDADLTSSVTVSIDGLQAAIEKAATSAKLESGATSEEGALKTGFGVSFSNGNSKNAEGDANGVVDTQAYAAAVLVDNEGRVVQVQFDALQSRFDFDKAGVIATTPDTTFKTKQTLGDDYNMRQASGIGKEWYEQADSFAAYIVGKTADEIKGITLEDADLASSVTMKIGAMQNAAVEAIESAQNLGAKEGDTIGLGIVGSAKQTKQEADDKGAATAVAYNFYAATSFDKQGVITSSIIDASQAKFEVKDDGTIATSLDTDFDTKLQLGDDYGMREASPIKKEWNEQAMALSEYIVGKKATEVIEMELKEGAPADADLQSSVTISVDKSLEAVAMSGQDALSLSKEGVRGEPVKIGLGMSFSQAMSKPAAADKDGLIDTQAYTAAVLVDDEGRVVRASIDAMQSKFDFTAEGKILTTPDTTFTSKRNLGDDYGMREASGIKREWFEQADDFAAWAVGKTAEEITNAKPEDADLASSVTMNLGAMQEALVKAIQSAEHKGARSNDYIGLGIVGSAKQTKQEADDKGAAKTVAYNFYGAVAFDRAGKITADILDASQASMEIAADGTITTALDAPVKTKNELGDEYGMREASPIKKEWNEQAAFFADYIVGKTSDEVGEIALEDGKPTDADLASGATVTVTGFLDVVKLAGEDALQEALADANSSGAVKTGLGVYFSNAKSKDATADAEGAIDTQAYVAAVLVDEDGKVVDVSIDALQSKFAFDQKGVISTTPDTNYTSKQLLGDDYGMREASPIGKEWYEQADAFEAFIKGKTKDEILGLTAEDADLASSVTVKLPNFVTPVVEAIDNAQDLGASADDRIGVGVLGSAKQTKQEGDDKGLATTVAYNYYAATSIDANGVITSQILDASQAKFEINADGTIATDIATDFKTKQELGDEYGMRKASEIKKEWNEQATSLAEYLVGKTSDEVANMELTDGAPADADLASSVTVSVDGLNAAVVQAIGQIK